MSQSYGRIAFLLLGVGIAVYACWKIAQRVDAFLYPWADERSGRPTLTGAWVGQFKTAGMPLGIKLELHRWRPPRGSQCSPCDPIEGTAMICDGSGVLWRYDISGKSADRRATRINLIVRPASRSPPDSPPLGGLHGSWHGNELELQAELHAANREPPESALLSMQRDSGAGLRLLCQGIPPGASR